MSGSGRALGQFSVHSCGGGENDTITRVSSQVSMEGRLVPDGARSALVLTTALLSGYYLCLGIRTLKSQGVLLSEPRQSPPKSPLMPAQKALVSPGQAEKGETGREVAASCVQWVSHGEPSRSPVLGLGLLRW